MRPRGAVPIAACLLLPGCWQPETRTLHAGPFDSALNVVWIGDSGVLLADAPDGHVRIRPGEEPTTTGIESAGRFAVDAAGELLAQVDDDELIAIELVSGDVLDRWPLHVPDGFSTTDVASVAWSSAGDVGTVGYKSFQVFRLGASQPVIERVGVGAGGDALAFSPAGDRVVAGGGSWPLVIYDLATGDELALSGGSDAVAAAFGVDSIVAVDDDGDLLAWTAAGESEEAPGEGLGSAGRAIAFDAAGETLAVADEWGDILVLPGGELHGGRQAASVAFERSLGRAAVSYCIDAGFSSDEESTRSCFVSFPALPR